MCPCFAKAKARFSTGLGASTHGAGAWRLRRTGLLACAVAGAFAASLLGLHGSRGADGFAPRSLEVECDHRYAGVSG